ncbi:MAG: RdgB/HAM1 family non-canonical purine NTP pyrophosphatase [Chloroflexi bacterium]|nr:RdgB/HAM1 family non-canonical purine NTP pyrophosphatase [Chloroflexota bacterium]
MFFLYPELFLATNNEGKIRELKKLATNLAEKFRFPEEFPDIPPPVENGETYHENAMIKALYYSEKTGLPSLADDSGLEIDFLGGAPGIRSSRFGGETSFREKMEHVLKLMEGVPEEKRGARFVCSAVLVWPDGEVVSGRGELKGRIADRIEGEGGFGYDPGFLLPEKGVTVAMISEEDKNRISHRTGAIKEILKKCGLLKDSNPAQ